LIEVANNQGRNFGRDGGEAGGSLEERSLLGFMKEEREKNARKEGPSSWVLVQLVVSPENIVSGVRRGDFK